jgi:hypothetical protein
MHKDFVTPDKGKLYLCRYIKIVYFEFENNHPQPQRLLDHDFELRNYSKSMNDLPISPSNKFKSRSYEHSYMKDYFNSLENIPSFSNIGIENIPSFSIPGLDIKDLSPYWSATNFVDGHWIVLYKACNQCIGKNIRFFDYQPDGFYLSKYLKSYGIKC